MKERTAEIVKEVSRNFETLGGGKKIPGNDLSKLLSDEPTQFALGVDVKAVVEFIISKLEE